MSALRAHAIAPKELASGRALVMGGTRGVGASRVSRRLTQLSRAAIDWAAKRRTRSFELTSPRRKASRRLPAPVSNGTEATYSCILSEDPPRIQVVLPFGRDWERELNLRVEEHPSHAWPRR